jgi:hypothetical protein
MSSAQICAVVGVSRSRLPSSGRSSPTICFVVAISTRTRAGLYCSLDRLQDRRSGRLQGFHGARPGACGGLFERPFVSWRDDVALFLGPRLAGYSAVDVEDQTEVEPVLAPTRETAEAKS